MSSTESEAIGDSRQTSNPTNYEQSILDFAGWMKKEGRSPSTIEGRCTLLRTMGKKCDLFDGDAVKSWIADSTLKGSTKKLWVVPTYYAFAKWKGFHWQKPGVPDSEPDEQYLPKEYEIDALIAGSGKKLATILQTAKETGARVGEIVKLQWKNLDVETGVLNIKAEKGSHSRTLKLSPKLVAMLQSLQKDKPTIFGRTNPGAISTDLGQSRKHLANKLQNPNLLRIHCHSFRHWYATMIYRRSKDILFTKQRLGHKSILSTIRYTHLIDAEFEQDEHFHSKAITTGPSQSKDADKLIGEGWDYVATTPDMTMLFRKKKSYQDYSKEPC